MTFLSGLPLPRVNKSLISSVENISNAYITSSVLLSLRKMEHPAPRKKNVMFTESTEAFKMKKECYSLPYLLFLLLKGA